MRLRRSATMSSGRRRVSAPPIMARGAPETYTLPEAPAGTLREIQLPTNDEAIQALFDAAEPGDSFIMPNTTIIFGHEPTLKVSGSVDHPISLRGTHLSIFEAEGGGDYGLHIIDASYNMILGGVFQTNKKGVVFDNSKFCTIRYAKVTHCEQEAIHFRASSSDGIAEYCTIEATGEASPGFGEGFYVGTHDGNWSTEYYDRSGPVEVSHGPLGNESGVDRSDRVTLRYCKVMNTTAEGLDYKQGTTGIVVYGNDFYACGWSNENSADSPIDLKGNNALIENNDFYPLMPDGELPTNPDTGLAYIQRTCIQARVLTAPYGHNHVIRNNRAHGSWDAYLFEQVSGSSGNTVYDDNTAPGATLGIANIALTPTGNGGGGGEEEEPETYTGDGNAFAGAVSWAAATTVTPSLPGGWQVGDLLIGVAFTRTVGTPTAPAGWTPLTSGTGPELGAALFTRVAQLGDTAPTFTASTGGSGLPFGAFIAGVRSWSGTPTVAGDYDEDPDEPTCPSISANANATILRIICLGDNIPPVPEPTTTVATLATWSMLNDDDDAGLGAWYRRQTSTGSTGTLAVNYVGNDPWIAYTIAVNAGP